MRNFRTERTNFNYNSDLSGEVHITNERGEEFEVNGECLLRFVTEYLRDQVISAIESLDTRALLRRLGLR